MTFVIGAAQALHHGLRSRRGVVIGELRRLPVSLEALLDFLKPFPQPVTIGMEATLYWHWLHDLYGRAGRAGLATVELPSGLRSQVDRLRRMHDALTAEIHAMDDEVKRLRGDPPMLE